MMKKNNAPDTTLDPYLMRYKCGFCKTKFQIDVRSLQIPEQHQPSFCPMCGKDIFLSDEPGERIAPL